MSELIPPGKSGNVEIVHDKASKLEVLRSAVKGIMTEERTHVRLLIDCRCWMTDAHLEQRTNRELLYQARGNVLLAGLGIGLVLPPILEKKEVDSVTVIEQNADVIALVAPHFKKVKVVCADIFEWEPPAKTKFETIYFDIWENICVDNLEAMAVLHKKFRKYRAKGGWMESWCRGQLKVEERRERRCGIYG